VRATIALARLIRQHQPRLWDFCLKLRKKDAVIAEIGVGRPFLHVSGMYGAERGCLALVWPLAPHPTNRNELIVWDLAFDPTELFDLDAETIRRRLFSRADALPEGETRLPIKTIHLNKSPVVIANLKTLSPAQAERWGLDVAQALRHAGLAEQRGYTLAGIWPEVFARPESSNPIDVDEDLYGGFLNDADRRRLQQARRLDPQRLAEHHPDFDDLRLAELLLRYRARNFPDTLLPAELQRWEQHRAERLHHGAGGGLSLTAYFERIDALTEQLAEADEERGHEILGALYDWAEQIAPAA
jgi:exodeoxyribonuclease-1